MGTFGRLGGIAAIALLAAFGVVAFATIAPSSEGRIEPPKRPIIEALPIRPDAAPAPKSYFREELFQRGDTLPAFIERLGIEAQHSARLAKLRVLQQLRPGTHVSAEVSADGEPLVLSFLSGRDTLVKIVAERGGPIVGATVVGPQAGELIHELMYVVGWEALPAEAAAFIHACAIGCRRMPKPELTRENSSGERRNALRRFLPSGV